FSKNSREGNFTVNIRYNRARLRTTLFQQAINNQQSRFSDQVLTFFHQPAKAFLAVLIIIFICGLLYFYLLPKQPIQTERATINESQQKPTTKQNIPDQQQLEPNNDTTNITKEQTTKQNPKKRSRDFDNDDDINDQILSVPRQRELALYDVQQIYIVQSNNDPLPPELYQRLAENLIARGFTLPTTTKLADAVLKLFLKEIDGKQVIEAQLINRRGKILLRSEFTTSNDPADLAARIVDYLVIEKTKSKQND
ncbi:MAG: hypothetical protein AB1489_36895, partial [Acidobacteriota bacterium]